MIGQAEELVRWLWNQPRDKTFEIKEVKDKRSKNANSYMWHLCSEIAQAITPPLKKEEVYMQMLEDFCQSMMIPVEVGKSPDVYFKYFKFIKTSEINGKEADWYKVFKGSSDYDTKEMSLLLDGIIQECEQLDICTLPPAEIQRLKEMWKK